MINEDKYFMVGQKGAANIMADPNQDIQSTYTVWQRCSSCGVANTANMCTSCGAAIPGTSRVNTGTTRVSFSELPVIIHQPSHAHRLSTHSIRSPSSPVKLEFQSSDRSMGVRIGDRLIYDFEKWPYGCFETGPGIDMQVKHELPIELSEKGVLAEQWFDWITDLHEIQKMAPSELGTTIMFCFPGAFIQALLCTAFCPISMNHCLSWLPFCHGDWYEELRKWMKNVNNILNEYGMHAKFITYKPPSSAPKSKSYQLRLEIRGYRYGYEMSFLAIALTPEESKRLQDESWDHGVNECLLSAYGRCV